MNDTTTTAGLAHQVYEQLVTRRFPVNVQHLGIGVGGSATTATLALGPDRAIFDEATATILFDTTRFQATAPARLDIGADHIVQAMVDGLIPDTHEPFAAPVPAKLHHWFI